VREHSLIREIRRNNERLAEHHEVFLQEVKENGFEAVSGAFGRGYVEYSKTVGGGGLIFACIEFGHGNTFIFHSRKQD